MCVMVYIGLDGPLVEFSSPADGEFGLEPDPDPVPKALANRSLVYGVAQHGAGTWCCSCDLYYHHLPWENEPPDPNTVHAYERLREIVAAAEVRALNPELFSCWSGDEDEALVVEWDVSANDLVSESNLIEEYMKTGGGFPPPSLFSGDSPFGFPSIIVPPMKALSKPKFALPGCWLAHTLNG